MKALVYPAPIPIGVKTLTACAIIALLAIFSPPAAPALADEPTVTLTASELQAVITAELAHAQAAGAIAKIGEALRPKQAAAEPVAPEQPTPHALPNSTPPVPEPTPVPNAKLPVPGPMPAARK